MMRALSAHDLLSFWEWGQVQPTTRRVLGLLAVAYPDLPRERLEALSVGRRDSALLAVRQALFGSRLPCLADCPSCGQPVEMEVDADALRGGEEANLEPTAEPPPLFIDGVEVRWRLPNVRDLAALESAADVADARVCLLRRTVLEARRGTEQLPVESLPEGVLAGVLEAMDLGDPLARIELDLICPGCGHCWLAPFDPSAYVWSEIDTLARQLLEEVHQLASAYGWRETDILAMGERRRWAYLEILNR
jgi:hypothetical protein